MVIIALALLVIILSATTADLLLQSNAKTQSHLSSPALVPLLGTHDFSTIVGGNWTGEPMITPDRVSNPSGLKETEGLGRSYSPQLFLQGWVEVYGFNSSTFSQFAYVNYQLDQLDTFPLYNPAFLTNTTRGMLSPSENYTINGFSCHGVKGNLPPGCVAISGIALSSLYVVKVLIIGGGDIDMPTSAVNTTTMRNLLGAQVLKTNSTGR